ncbi:MAG: AmmeMemoRadiSam system protein A [Firmicutes bacterium]|nr:AmmeMemoRadiSam system protein A [Bacillota bacterium]
MPILASFMVPHPPLIVPAVGRGGEKQIASTTAAYEQVARDIAALKPDTIVISSPHATMYSDYFHISPGLEASGSFAQFRAPEVSFREEYDTELVAAICKAADKRQFPAGVAGERDAELDHGTMVPLWFIRQACTDFKLVRMGLSGLPLTDHYLLGQLIREAVDATGKRVVFVASGDLSHKLQPHGPYGFAPEGPQYDARIMDVCGRAAFGELLDFDETFCERAAECGHRSFTIMAGVWDGTAVRASVLSHEDVTGVGYGICTFYPEGPDGDRNFLDQHMQRLAGELSARKSGEDAWVRLARESLEAYVIRRETIDVPQGLPAELLERRAGAFVSLHEHGQLRGCIGTIAPTADCLAREIIQNAVSACSRDPRFMPVRREELPWLEISVDVLGEAEDISSMDQLDVKRYGVIVSRGGRRGLLLPDLDGVDTVEQQVSIARQKAGIGPGEKVSLQRFEVVRHS